MRSGAFVLLVVVLAGSAKAAPDGQIITGDGPADITVTNTGTTVPVTPAPPAPPRRRPSLLGDVVRSYGHGYAETGRAYGRILRGEQSILTLRVDPPPPVTPPHGGTPVYQASQCAGPVIAGVCHGVIVPNGRPPLVCHGTMLNGHCTGPMF